MPVKLPLEEKGSKNAENSLKDLTKIKVKEEPMDTDSVAKDDVTKDGVKEEDKVQDIDNMNTMGASSEPVSCAELFTSSNKYGMSKS